MPKIVSQQTIDSNGDKIEKFGVEIEAANEFVARQRVRGYMRRQFPTIKNIMTPELTSQNTKQSTFNDIVPKTIEVKEFVITVTVVR